MFQSTIFWGTSVLSCWTLLLSVIILSSIDHRWIVHAAPRSSPRSNSPSNLHRRINNNIPGPDVSDYPSDEVIYITCGELAINQCVMFTEIGDSFPAKWFAHLTGKKIYTDLFPEDPEPFTKMLQRSVKWYQDFADRYSRIYSERCSGEVFLMSNWPRGPVSTCSVWYRIEFPVLKMNPAVTKITLVDKLNYDNQVEIWPEDRRRPEDRGDGDGDDGGGGDPRNPLEPGPDRPRLPGVSPVGAGAAAALGLLLEGGPAAAGTVLIPSLGSVFPSLPAPAPSDTPSYNPNGENLQDVLFGDSASVPGPDWNTFTGDGSLDISILPQGADGGSTDGLDDLFASDPKQPSLWSNKDDSAGLFAAADTDLFSTSENSLTRRFAMLEERDRETCFDWAGDGDDPALTHVGTGDDPTIPQTGKVGWATIHVVQYQRVAASEPYTFDLVLNDGGLWQIAQQEGIRANAGEWVGITLSGTSQVYVKAGNNDEDPLQFRFGLNEWDSNDVQTHECRLDEWKGGLREGDCRFTY